MNTSSILTSRLLVRIESTSIDSYRLARFDVGIYSLESDLIACLESNRLDAYIDMTLFDSRMFIFVTNFSESARLLYLLISSIF